MQMLGAPEPGAGSQIDKTTVRCPECGGLNPADAEWCGQCLARFAQAEPEPTEEEGAETAGDDFEAWLDLLPNPEPDAEPVADPKFDPLIDPFPHDPSVPVASVPESGSTDSGPEAPEVSVDPTPRRAGAFAIAGDKISWSCSRCDADNPLEASVCQVCGASFADVVESSAPRPYQAQRDPNMAAFVSLFFPGAGHAYLGMWGQAVARAALSVWVIGAAVFALLGRDAPGALFIGIVFGLAAVALWAVAAHDAFREASGQSSQVLLKPRIFLYVTIALLFLLFSSLMMAGFSVARRG